jgi:hypothetical protein
LARRQHNENVAAIRAHSHLKPTLGAGEYAAAKIQIHGEQPFVNDNGRMSHRPAQHAPTRGQVMKRESQIVSPARGPAVFRQPALVSESCALREHDRDSEIKNRERQDDEKECESGFHVCLSWRVAADQGLKSR